MYKFILTLAAGLVAASAATAASAYKDGVYEGTAQGKEAPITVSVTVKAGKIAAVKLVKHGDTLFLIQPAFDKISKAMVKANSTGVDKMSGATLSSTGIIGAVEDALKKAK